MTKRAYRLNLNLNTISKGGLETIKHVLESELACSRDPKVKLILLFHSTTIGTYLKGEDFAES